MLLMPASLLWGALSRRLPAAAAALSTSGTKETAPAACSTPPLINSGRGTKHWTHDTGLLLCYETREYIRCYLKCLGWTNGNAVLSPLGAGPRLEKKSLNYAEGKYTLEYFHEHRWFTSTGDSWGHGLIANLLSPLFLIHGGTPEKLPPCCTHANAFESN